MNLQRKFNFPIAMPQSGIASGWRPAGRKRTPDLRTAPRRTEAAEFPDLRVAPCQGGSGEISRSSGGAPQGGIGENSRSPDSAPPDGSGEISRSPGGAYIAGNSHSPRARAPPPPTKNGRPKARFHRAFGRSRAFRAFCELLIRIELMTSSLPRMCSTD